MSGIFTVVRRSRLNTVDLRRGDNANQWIHVLLPVLLAALRALGDAPARSLTALAQRLGVSDAEASTMVVPLEEPAPVVAGPAAVPTSLLLPMTGRNGGSSAPKTLLNRLRVIAARKRTIRLKARIIFTRHDVIMLWWVLDMTHRQTEEPGWNDHGVSLARWDSLQTDYSGCRGLLVSCL
jgi:hypothetical protein